MNKVRSHQHNNYYYRNIKWKEIIEVISAEIFLTQTASLHVMIYP